MHEELERRWEEVAKEPGRQACINFQVSESRIGL